MSLDINIFAMSFIHWFSKLFGFKDKNWTPFALREFDFDYFIWENNLVEIYLTIFWSP